jgi:AcrR family transcriptional regulator
LSSRTRKPLDPQREIGRQRVAELMEAAAAVLEERGLEAATMAEIAARADARIGSLYRFFPNKEAVADALLRLYAEVLDREYAAIRTRAREATPEELADILIDLLVKLHPQTRAITALLDSRDDWAEIRLRIRRKALAGLKAAVLACAPALGDQEAEDISAVVLVNMKAMKVMALKDGPNSPGAPDELRLMNRLYLGARLAGARHGTPDQSSL